MASTLIQHVFDFSLYVVKNVTLQQKWPLIRIQTSVRGLLAAKWAQEMRGDDGGWLRLSVLTERGRRAGGEKGTRGGETEGKH